MTQQPDSDIPDDLIEQVKARHAVARRRRSYDQRASKLEPHRAHILKLHRGGASLRQIQFYLQTMARPSVVVQPSTIMRYLNRLEAGISP